MSKQSFLRGRFVSHFAHDLSREHTAGLWNLLVVLTGYQAGPAHPHPADVPRSQRHTATVFRRWWHVNLLTHVRGQAKPRSHGLVRADFLAARAAFSCARMGRKYQANDNLRWLRVASLSMAPGDQFWPGGGALVGLPGPILR